MTARSKTQHPVGDCAQRHESYPGALQIHLAQRKDTTVPTSAK